MTPTRTTSFAPTLVLAAATALAFGATVTVADPELAGEIRGETTTTSPLVHRPDPRYIAPAVDDRATRGRRNRR